MGPDGPGPRAAIDCGTNSTRLLVAAPDGSALERRMRITRLGEGVDATRRLSPAAIARTCAVLADYRRAMERHGVRRARMVATSALRDATNGAEFLDAARRATGVEPEVLSGLEEGELSFAGATAGLPGAMAGPGPVLVVDIGGGSTELMAGRVGEDAGTPADLVVRSLDIGCVRVTERYISHDPPPPAELDAARTAVEHQLHRARASMPALDPDGTLIGLAGTVSTLAALEHGLAEYRRDRIHHSVLTRSAVVRWLGLLAHEGAAQRRTRPGMEEGRVDVIVAGVLILASVMAIFAKEACLVSEDDILDGLVAHGRSARWPA
ncbi:MAG TPA: Ppx/GppA phosphatase family protein [Acidimicrobiales bacterium]|nr:Ppx/GppA phosphatase family protein [Acidimicrobiales bacterium]